MTPADAPTVFVVDDDPGVRGAIQGLLKSVGLHAETFESPQEFLRSRRSRRPKLPGSGREASGSQRSGLSAPVGGR